MLLGIFAKVMAVIERYFALVSEVTLLGRHIVYDSVNEYKEDRRVI